MSTSTAAAVSEPGSPESATPEPLMPAVRPWIMALVAFTVLSVLVYVLADLGTRVLWLKTLHVIAVVSWFAGIFYLPRLFVYHATVEVEDVRGHERFCLMERKLYRFITPFLVMTLGFGTLILVEYGMPYFRTSAWLHVKITLVLGLVGYHLWLGFHGRAIRLGQRTRDHKFYRVINELPVLVLFAVVALVFVKPF